MKKVFVSYSHKNHQWVSTGDYDLILWLESQLKAEGIEVWWDRELKRLPGIEYEEMIKEKIAEANMAILLLSPEYASSKFIKEIEEPLIRERYDKGELLILPIVITPITNNQRKSRLAWMFDTLEIVPNDKSTLLDIREEGVAKWSHLRTDLVNGICNRFAEFDKIQEERLKLEEKKRNEAELKARKEAEKLAEEQAKREAIEKRKLEQQKKEKEQAEKIAERKAKVDANIHKIKTNKFAKSIVWLSVIIAVVCSIGFAIKFYIDEQKKYLLYLSDSDFETVEDNGKFGFKLKQTGDVIIPIKYSSAGSFINGLAKVRIGEKYGLINKIGKIVVPFEYDEIQQYPNDGLRVVSKDNKEGVIDLKGNIVIPIEYDNLEFSYASDLFLAKKNEKYGFIDKSNNVIIQIKYDKACTFQEERAYVELNNKCGFVDVIGNEIVPLLYDSSSRYYNQGLVAVKKDGKWGCIDKNGELKFGFTKYEEIGYFSSDGLAMVRLYGEYGAIDMDGKVVIPLIYDDKFYFNNGKAKVKLNGEEFYINTKGEKIVE